LTTNDIQNAFKLLLWRLFSKGKSQINLGRIRSIYVYRLSDIFTDINNIKKLTRHQYYSHLDIQIIHLLYLTCIYQDYYYYSTFYLCSNRTEYTTISYDHIVSAIRRTE